jgi:hypothetical protein
VEKAAIVMFWLGVVCGGLACYQMATAVPPDSAKVVTVHDTVHYDDFYAMQNYGDSLYELFRFTDVFMLLNPKACRNLVDPVKGDSVSVRIHCAKQGGIFRMQVTPAGPVPGYP